MLKHPPLHRGIWLLAESMCLFRKAQPNLKISNGKFQTLVTTFRSNHRVFSKQPVVFTFRMFWIFRCLNFHNQTLWWSRVSSQEDICVFHNQPYFHSALQASSHTFIWLCILSFGFARIHIQNVLNFSASSEWLFEFPQPKITMVSLQANIMCFPGNQLYFHSALHVV